MVIFEACLPPWNLWAMNGRIVQARWQDVDFALTTGLGHGISPEKTVTSVAS